MADAGPNEIIVVSLGAGGAFSISKTTTVRVASPTVPIRSKVGAGDSMVAGLVLSLAQGLSLSETLAFAVAAGAAAVMTPGTQLCRREDVHALFERIMSEEITI